MASAILEAAKHRYARATWRIPEDFLQRSHFERVVRNKLDWTSSPGYPYMLRANTNRVLFQLDSSDRPSAERLDFFWQIVQKRLQGEDPDPIRLFVKAEAHTQRKLDSEKYRLISSVGIVDQIVDHMLFDPLNDALIENCLFVPSKPGWSPFGGGHRIIPTSGWIATDASSWDWTVRPWLLELVLQFRYSLCENPTEEWLHLARRRYQALFKNPLFITSKGLLLRQLTPGAMKSGCVNTIADNSMMQDLLHLRVCLELGIGTPALFSMGDDRLQRAMARRQEYFDMTAQFCVLKSLKDASEFAGFEFFDDGRVEPVHRGKHAFNLLHMREEFVGEMASSYVLNYHRSRFCDWFRSLFDCMGVKVFTRDFCDLVFDGQ